MTKEDSYCSTFKFWEEMTPEDIDRKLSAAEAEIQTGRVHSSKALEEKLRKKFQNIRKDCQI